MLEGTVRIVAAVGLLVAGLLAVAVLAPPFLVALWVDMSGHPEHWGG